EAEHSRRSHRRRDVQEGPVAVERGYCAVQEGRRLTMIPTKPYKFIVAAVGGLLSVVLALLGLTDVLPANVAAILTVAAQVLTAEQAAAILVSDEGELSWPSD